MTTIAGSAYAFAEADGTGTSAKFDGPTGITVTGTGVGTNLYVTDQWAGTIRQVVISSGVVTTFAGAAYAFSEADGSGTGAKFNNPFGITTDGTNLYVADYSGPTIRQIVINSGVVTTIAGTAGTYNLADGTGASATFSNPAGLSYIPSSSSGPALGIVDTGNNMLRFLVLSSGVVTTTAGGGRNGYKDGTESGYGQNSVGNTNFNNPWFSVSKSDGSEAFVADFDNNAIRQVSFGTTAATVSTLAGFSTVGTSLATGTAASFDNPQNTVSDGTNLYVADQFNGVIRKIVLATGVETVLAGSLGQIGEVDGTGSSARFGAPSGLTMDSTSLYVADNWGNTIRKIVIATGQVTTLAGSSSSSGSLDGAGTNARFNGPNAIATDGTNLYVTDQNNDTIRQVTKTGVVTTLAGSAGNYGEVNATGTSARFGNPTGIACDGTNLYVADNGQQTIRKVVISTSVVTTIAGVSGTGNEVDGVGTSALFWGPWGLATDGTNLYISDQGGQTIRKLVLATDAVSTLAGVRGIVGVGDGVGTAAYFDVPAGLAIAGSALYVSQALSSNNIRKIVLQ